MPEITPSRYTVSVGWGEVPHLSEQAKRELLDATPPHLRDARSKGIPSLGSGAIYPVPWEQVECAPFAIPDYWPRAYGMDVGWKVTGALWAAWDPSDWSMVVYSEHYRQQEQPPVHAAAIRARGSWIRGVIDPASRGRGQDDGRALIETYREHGLDVVPADNSVEAGLYDVWTGLTTGRIRFFSTLRHLRDEYRIYRRDVHGRIVKERDHLMDCLRYVVRSGRTVAAVRPMERGAIQAASSSILADVRGGY